MASKKYILLVALFVAFSVAGFAQTTDWGWNWKDSSKVPSKSMPQYNEFLQNNYPYPAKPRNQWELGFSAGTFRITGDVKAKAGFGGGLSLRKALNHVFSVRGQYLGSFNHGVPNTYGTSIGQREYKTLTHQALLEVVTSLNTLSGYRGNPNWNLYIFGGYGVTANQIRQNVGGNYQVFYAAPYPNSQAGLLTTIWGAEHNNRKGWAVTQGFSIGAGFAKKINNRINIGLEQRFIFTSPGYDLNDGYQDVASRGVNDITNRSNDFFSNLTARLNYNLGSSSKKVQPLWWINPNNYIYNEVNAPQHMKMPKVKLDDKDGDGVTDQFDLEPNTPAGAKVDARGRALDTDGDGIPDFRDKEPLTPQKWFPVNNEGVGTAPEPNCCKELRDELSKVKDELASGVKSGASCSIDALPSIQFKGGNKLSKDAQAVLATVAQKINANPNCKVKVIGYASADKKSQQASWEKVNAVIKFLVEKQGVAESRFIFTYGQQGDVNTVDLQGTTEDGPNTVPAPHPHM